MNFTNTLKYIGGIYLTYKAISFLKWSFQFLPSPSNSLQSKYGNGWVIITGGSSGIGLSYAKAFLSLNYNVCILSHSSDKLNSAYETLTQLNPTSSSQVRYIKYDLNRNYDENDYNELTNKIMKATDNGNISILINNAGVITRGNFITNSIIQITSMININIKATVFLTKLILTIHKSKNNNNNNHKLLIITSGSIAGKGRYAGRSVYSGTKYFLESFMESIAKENKDDIDCTCFEIGPVETEMNKADVKFKLQSDDFVNKALTYIGRGNIIRSGCFTHEMYIRLREIGIIEGLIDNMIIPKKL